MLDDKDLQPRGKGNNLWKHLMETSQDIAVEEIRKEISRAILELRNQNKIDFQTWEKMEGKSRGTAKKIFNRVLKFETALEIYGEAVLDLSSEFKE